ncbi:MAG: 2Fe-2S iron-sulfur cluster-binding protein [Pseudomonadota bacterium]
MNLVVRPLDKTLAFAPGANLLQVLRDNAVPVSYSCMSGRCGTCRCKLINGAVLESGGESKITQPNDNAYVLACMSVLTENCTIEIPEPDEVVVHPARIIKATVIAVEDLTHDIRRVRLRPSKPLEFTSGQYASLQFGPGLVRPYSMVGLSSDEELEFHVRLLPDGRVSGYIAGQLQAGDTVRVTGPMGAAYLRKKYDGPMLCVAGGTGLAPVLSIVRGALEAGMKNPIHLYFGVRSPSDVYGVDRLQALAAMHGNLSVHVVVATGNDNSGYRSGLVTSAVEEDWETLSGWRAYLCGAPPMVEAATLLVKQKGMLAEHVHADAFYPAAT